MSTIKVDTIQSTGGGAVTLTNQHAAKAWVTFDGTASGATIGDSFNVSSTTDTQTGYVIINMTNGFNNTAYASVGNTSGFSVNDLVSTRYQSTTSSADDLRIYDGSYRDASFSYAAFGDLA